MNLQERLRKVPAFVLGLVSMGSVLLAALFLFNGWWQDGERTASEQLVKLDRLQSVAAYGKVLDGLSASSEPEIYQGLFLAEGTAAVVSADLLAKLKEMSAAMAIEVLRADSLQPKTEGSLTLVGGGLEMSGSSPAIYGLIQQIEAAGPLLFIERLAIRSSGSTGEQERNETPLVVEMQVYGAVRSSKLMPAAGAN